MSYAAKVVADSIGPHGKRITTMVVTFPRFILAEVNTHRMLSRNSASSRAIPPEKLIERVRNNPFVPETFNQRVKGMGVGDALDEYKSERSRKEWLLARDAAVDVAQELNRIGVDKSRVNRLLEPFLWHTALITATEWDNFFALRQPMNDDPVPQRDHGAQPEFQIVARLMRDAMRDSTPAELDYGDWHLPFAGDPVTNGSEYIAINAPYMNKRDFLPLVSAGRCFVVSYDRLDEIEDEDPIKGFERADRGKDIGHWSPLEHPAVCCEPQQGALGMYKDDWYANFQGWRQLRSHYPNEADFSKVLAAQQ